MLAEVVLVGDRLPQPTAGDPGPCRRGRSASAHTARVTTESGCAGYTLAVVSAEQVSAVQREHVRQRWSPPVRVRSAIGELRRNQDVLTDADRAELAALAEPTETEG